MEKAMLELEEQVNQLINQILLKAENMDFEVYSEIQPNPTIENVQGGVAAFKKAGADYIIAIGGGSSQKEEK